ncbi:hypothetical protein Aperf_G00000019699 [Anoplocephala perfoliata]
MQPFKAVRNLILKKQPVIESFGGKILGISSEDTLSLRGFWNRMTGLIILSCPDVKCADEVFSVIHLKEEFPQHVEYFTVNLSNPAKCISGFPLVEISFYDVRYIQRFNDYSRELPKVAFHHNGHLIAGTSKIIQKLGMSRPNFCTITQWRNVCEFQKYREDAMILFDKSESACVTQGLIKLNAGSLM